MDNKAFLKEIEEKINKSVQDDNRIYVSELFDMINYPYDPDQFNDSFNPYWDKDGYHIKEEQPTKYLFLVTLTEKEVKQFKRICESFKRVEKEMQNIDARLNTPASYDILCMAKKDYELMSKLAKSLRERS